MPKPEVVAAMLLILQRRALADHHHLISPWMYTPGRIAERNANLLRSNWS